ncbi:MAG: hypothetical protein H7644_13060, partial [Candidatus Heimdallarchaeota archaeon]|nr:hypothetical protein [Candidatus Heimdallarchaeota archaeon]MCK5144689.1 hypothetical protein [Candidatus Heimdallarchaeota archaeon]
SESDLVVLFGGAVATNRNDYLNETWVYDTNTDTWTFIEPPTTTATNFYIASLIVAIAAISLLKIRRKK